MVFLYLLNSPKDTIVVSNTANHGSSEAPLFLCVPIGRCTSYYIQYISLKKFLKFVQMLIKMI